MHLIILACGSWGNAQKRLSPRTDVDAEIGGLGTLPDVNHRITPFISVKCSHRGQNGSSAGSASLKAWFTLAICPESEDDSARRRSACSSALSPSRDLAFFNSNTSEVSQASTLPCLK